MSGSAFAPWFYGEETVNVSLNVAKNVGCSSTDSGEILSCMRSKTNEELLLGVKQLKHEGVIANGFNPRNDNDFFPDSTLEKLIQDSPPKPTIIGATTDEMGLFVTPTHPHITTLWTIKEPKSFTLEQLRKNMREIFVDLAYSDPCLLTDLAVYHYVDSQGSRDDPLFLTQAWKEFLGDLFFIAPAVKEAHLRRESGSKVWLYLFDYFNVQFAPGSFHFYDLWYFFRMILYRSNVYSEEELKIANYYTTLFTNFAKFGDPTKTTVDGIQWPQTNNEFPERFLKIGKSLEVDNYFKRPAIAFWNELLPLLKKQSDKRVKNVESETMPTKKDEL